MAIKVIIERKTIPENEPALTGLLMKLRAEAINVKGYISGETLQSVDDPNNYIVISTWDSLEHWQAWENSEKRKQIQGKIDALLQTPSVHHVYVYG
jgi:heme-degrading monooxygenase HmoA